MIITAINTRIKEMVSHFADGNNSRFAELVGTNEANIRNYINGTQPKFDFISTVADKFEVNYEWLLVGRGDMLMRDSAISINQKNVRLICRYAYFDYVKKYSDEVYLSNLPLVAFPGNASTDIKQFLAFEVADDSMNSHLKCSLFLGDIALGHLLNAKTYRHTPQVLINGYPLVIVTHNDVYIKKISAYDRSNETFMLHSTNVLFEDILLPSDSIIQVFSIRQVVRNLQ